MAGIFVESGETTGGAVFAKKSLTPAQTFGDIEGLSFDLNRRGHLFISEEVDYEKAYDDAVDGYEQLFGERLPNPWSERIKEADDLGGKTLVERQMNWFNAKTAQARLRVPENQWHLLPTRADIENNIPVASQKREEFYARVSEDTGFFGAVAGFLGTARAFLTDPPTLFTMPFGIGFTTGRTTARAMGQAFMRESLLATTAEILTQPTVQIRRKEELGFEDAGFMAGARNVLAAAIASGTFAGILVGGGKEAARLLSRLEKKLIAAEAGDLRAMAKELRASGDPTAKVLADDLDASANHLDSNPLEPVKTEVRTDDDAVAREAAEIEHDVRTESADDALPDGVPPDIPDKPNAPVSGQIITDRADNTGAGTFPVDPATVNVDAERFQFKSGGDPSGVSERLRGVEEWDQAKAGLIMVWEDAAGKRFVVDGHQRIALANRLLKEGKMDPDIRINAIVRKETDGITAQQARSEAAWKNISEVDQVSPQLARDAAVALRLRPEDMDRLLKTAPRSTTMIRTVENLVNLSDASFRHVINEKVTPSHAALVSRLVEGEEKQDAIINLLVDLKVKDLTDFEAESIIRQAREAGTKKTVQDTLFGKEELETSLFRERAKVLKQAVAKLRKEKSIFRGLAKNKDQIQDEGNILKTDTNQQIAQDAAVAVELLQRLANRTGALSDALTQAAREAGETGKFGPATDQFIDSVREAIVRGDFEGESVRPSGRVEQTPTQNRTDNLQRKAVADAEAVGEQAELSKGDAQVRPEIDRLDQEFKEAAADNPNERVVVEEGDAITMQRVVDDVDAEKEFLDDIGNCLL